MRPHLQKTKPVSSPAVLGEYARTHWFCMACGADWTARHVHHILGGRCGRSDEPCNLGSVCAMVCHPFCDLAKNLGVVLSMKARIGELDADALERLAALNLKPLPALEEIPAFFAEQFKRNRPELETR